METFKDGTTTEEQAVIIAMAEIAAAHREFDANYSQLPSGATEQQALLVRYYLAKLHDDLGYGMKFDFVPLLIDGYRTDNILFIAFEFHRGGATKWLNKSGIENQL